jgi:hypothetical protein
LSIPLQYTPGAGSRPAQEPVTTLVNVSSH